jgi:hypothetical protein
MKNSSRAIADIFEAIDSLIGGHPMLAARYRLQPAFGITDGRVRVVERRLAFQLLYKLADGNIPASAEMEFLLNGNDLGTVAKFVGDAVRTAVQPSNTVGYRRALAHHCGADQDADR